MKYLLVKIKKNQHLLILFWGYELPTLTVLSQYNTLIISTKMNITPIQPIKNDITNLKHLLIIYAVISNGLPTQKVSCKIEIESLNL